MKVRFSRREALIGAGVAGLALGLPALGRAETRMHRIPSSGEALPPVGLGTSRVFNSVSGETQRQALADVLEALFAGGTLVDTSPMYGNSEAHLGELLPLAAGHEAMFCATKVWTEGRAAGAKQMQESMDRMGLETIDLMQVHNLLDWKAHLRTMLDMQAAGQIRYLGITTSRAVQFDEFEAVMRAANWDFVQLNYSLGEREAEERLLPLAQELGMAVMVNRPFVRGGLFQAASGKELPEVAAELGCESPAQLFLKWILGHPAVTCVIPATSKAKHMVDNLGAALGPLPDAEQRQRIAAWI
ncbi:MAG: aldo/keto reductase [Gammaproteobacteria bacterium]|nr:aldo/keto reductase [Gammaproteobacteria bacterium]